jgi:signal transduction histidine kinase
VSEAAPGRWHRRARHALGHSLRLRLLALFLLLALATTAAFLAGMQKAFSLGWREAAKPLLADYVQRLGQDLGSPPSVERAQALVQTLPLSVRIEGPVVNWDSHPTKHPLLGTSSWDARHPNHELRLLEYRSADGHHIRFGLGDISWEQQPRQIGWITLAVLLALTALAYAYVRRLLRPLDDIRAGAQRFGAGDFSQTIPLRWRDELGDLAGQINTMAHDIAQMLDAKRTLLLAMSHELRSPLTRARLHAELLPDDPTLPEIQSARAALLRDLGEMRDLITDLLESERLASPHAALSLEPTNLAALVREVISALPNAPALKLETAQDMPLLAVDRTRIRLLLRNLLDNALRHGADATMPLELELSHLEQQVQLRVRDYGPGVDEAQLARLAEPFFRPDSARQRATGGVGLGLYLCRLVAQAHGGTLSLRNAHPGLEITVRLPDGTVP